MFVMVATRIICGFSRSTTSTFIPGLNLCDFIFWVNTTKRCKETTSRPFSHDVITATLVDHNNKMAVTLVHQNNPLGIELYLYPYISLCFMESIAPLVTRLKTFETKQSNSQSFFGFSNNFPDWEGL